MANVTVTLSVPEERLDAVYAAAGGGRPAPVPPTEAPRWDKIGVSYLKGDRSEIELRLVRRLAEALGQRVPIAELARDFGLPKATSIDRDFPALRAFCEKDPAKRPFPVVAEGDGDAGWYWMSVTAASGFQAAFSHLPGD